MGEQEHIGYEEQDLPGHVADDGLHRSADGLEENAGGDDKAQQKADGKKLAEAFDGKLIIQCALLAEGGHDHLGAQLEAEPAADRDQAADGDGAQIYRFHPGKFLCAVIVAHDGLAADAQAHHHTDNDGIDPVNTRLPVVGKNTNGLL